MDKQTIFYGHWVVQNVFACYFHIYIMPPMWQCETFSFAIEQQSEVVEVSIFHIRSEITKIKYCIAWQTFSWTFHCLFEKQVSFLFWGDFFLLTDMQMMPYRIFDCNVMSNMSSLCWHHMAHIVSTCLLLAGPHLITPVLKLLGSNSFLSSKSFYLSQFTAISLMAEARALTLMGAKAATASKLAKLQLNPNNWKTLLPVYPLCMLYCLLFG